MWMDHRAKAEADLINSGNHNVLKYVGGRLSPEMQIPKLLWLRENNPDTYRNAGYFMDLPDFLTYRATGRDIRSICSATCKWTYLAEENRWDPEFFGALSLEDLLEYEAVKIGRHIGNIGATAGDLLPGLAKVFGLHSNVKVAISIIDAHAGTLGTIGARNLSVNTAFKKIWINIRN
ncbi:unnamed protein product, partial [Mesorhabditis spiculigera]